MLSATKVDSFAGTWGKERKVKLAPPGKRNGDYTTTFTSSFDADKFLTHQHEENNKFAKFVSMSLFVSYFFKSYSV
jgi:hypothetical protein